jgi:hypothetical protein
MLAAQASDAQAVRFTTGTDVLETSNGYVKLEWENGDNASYELQQATSADFADSRTIYKGPDKASFISGLEDGNYYFRVRSAEGPWSLPVQLIVKHQSLQLAFTLFGIGAVVFLLTVFVVIKGVRNSDIS